MTDVAVAVPATSVPPNDTVVQFWSPVPVRVKTVPGYPPTGEMVFTIGGGRIVKDKLLVATPLHSARTEAEPLGELFGTEAMIVVEFGELAFPRFALISTVEQPLRLTPVMVSVPPGSTELGEIDVIDTEDRMVNVVVPLLEPAPVVTTKGPVVAPTGINTTINVSAQWLYEVAGVPLNVTVPELPKLLPLITIGEP